MTEDVKNFCKSCLHCQSTLGGDRVPRPLGHALHADKPNELLHFDFLYIGPGTNSYECVLIIKDDASSYVWLEPTTAANAKSATTALTRWFSCFGVSLTWNSDQGAHFKNEVMQALNRAYHGQRHFTTAYAPQANGTVERVCREVLRACRALLSEFKLHQREWPAVVHIIQSILNHTIREILGNRAPITCFLGLPATDPLRSLFSPEHKKALTVDFVKLQQVSNVNAILAALDDMHRAVAQIRSRNRKAQVARHNAKTNVKPVNFEVGDFVLVADALNRAGRKLQVKWKGPRRVTQAISPFVYEVQDLVTEKISNVHYSRLKFYSDSSLDVTEALLDTISHNDPPLYNIVEKLLDLRYNDDTGNFEVQTQWQGFDYEDPTWEPLHTLKQDIPAMTKQFLEQFPNRTLADAAMKV